MSHRSTLNCQPAGHAHLSDSNLTRCCVLGRQRCLRIDWGTDAASDASNLQAAEQGRPGFRKDANDVLVQDGIQALKRCIAQPQPLGADGPFQ